MGAPRSLETGNSPVANHVQRLTGTALNSVAALRSAGGAIVEADEQTPHPGRSAQRNEPSALFDYGNRDAAGNHRIRRQNQLSTRRRD